MSSPLTWANGSGGGTPISATNLQKISTRPAFINVKDYGAIGDGSTNDTTAVQAALTAVPSTGATVFFPAGLYLVPSGGLTCSNPVHLLGTSGNYFAGVGSAIKVTADHVTALTLSGQSTHLESFGVFHPASGSRSGDLIGVVLDNSVFNRVEKCHISGFASNVVIDDGYYWSFSQTLFEDGVNVDLDIQNTGSPDSGDGSVQGCTFFRNENASPGGRAVIWRSAGGLRFVNNKVNGGTDRYIDCLDLVPSDGVSTSVLVVASNSFENFTGNGIAINPAATTGLLNNSVMITGNEITSFDTTASTGVQIDMPITGVTITGNHFYHLTNGVDVQQVHHAVMSGNSFTDIKTNGVRVRDSAVNVIVDKQPIDMQSGGVAVRFDLAKTVGEPSYETSTTWDFSDASNHDLFEIGMAAFTAAIVDIDLTGTNEGVGTFARRFCRLITSAAAAADSSTATIGTDYTATGSITVNFTTAALGGPLKIGVQKTAGTSFNGQIHVRVHGNGVETVKQLVRTA